MVKLLYSSLITFCLLICVFLCEHSMPATAVAGNTVNILQENVYKEMNKFLSGNSTKILSGFDLAVVNGAVNINTGTILIDNHMISFTRRSLPISTEMSSANNNRILYLYADNTELVLSAHLKTASTVVPLYLIILETNLHISVIDLRRLNKSEQTINVTLVGGGKNNGSDETASIETALIIARYLGGGKVLIPNGDYIVHGNIKIPSNTVLAFEESAKLILIKDAKCDFVIGGDKVDNIRIIGGVIEDGNLNKSNKYISAIYCWNECKNWKIENTKIVNSNAHGIYFNSGSNIAINNISIDSPLLGGIGIFKSKGNIVLQNCSVINAGSNGIEITGINDKNPCNNVNISHTDVYKSHGNNLVLSLVSKSKISNNNFRYSIKHAGIFCQACNNVNITDNILSNNWDGLLLNLGSSSNTIDNNTFSNNEQDGVDIAYGNGSNNLVKNNKFIENGVWGLYLIETNSNIINNNIFNNNGIKAVSHNTHKAAIQIDKGTFSNVIENNEITTNNDTVNNNYAIFESKNSGVNIIGINKLTGLGKVFKDN